MQKYNSSESNVSDKMEYARKGYNNLIIRIALLNTKMQRI